MSTVKDLGLVTAYAYAVSKGYEGTEEEFAALMASYATVAEEAEGYAEQAEAAKDLAESARNQAEEWASGSVGGDPSETNNSKYYSEQAADQASEAARQAGLADASAIAAGQSEGAAASSASTASTKAGEAAASATAAAGSATTAGSKASEASESATNAATAKTAAQAAQTAAETAQGKAEDAQEVAEAAAEHAEATLNSYAKVDGAYSSMTVGNAEQLVATVAVEDSVPYNFRTSGGAADIGDREVDKIVGGTVVWNQKAKMASDGWSLSNISFAANEHEITITATSSSTALKSARIICASDHVYFAAGQSKSLIGSDTVGATVGFYAGNGSARISANNMTASYGKFAVMYKPSVGTDYFALRMSNPAAADSQIVCKDVQLFDLTQMFGPTIADYVYGLETAAPGTGATWFRKLFPRPYYAYNPGELMSVQAAAHKMVGFNAFNDTLVIGKKWQGGEYVNGANNGFAANANKVRVVSGATYCIAIPGITAGTSIYVNEFDAAGTWLRVLPYFSIVSTNNPNKYATFTTSADSHFVALSMYRGTNLTTAELENVNVNLSWDGERDGEYEPYAEHTYPLDDSLTLRGIPRLDSGNGLYYDGDTYESDGTVTRRYGTRAYVEGDEALENAVTDGVNTVYLLETPTTETADPYQSPQIVDDFGTEEYVDAAVAAETRDVAVPVGHDTLYQANLRAKLEMAPDSPDGDGDYIVRQTNGQNAYVPLMKELPTAPTTEGTYHLKAAVSGGSVTLTWEADT